MVIRRVEVEHSRELIMMTIKMTKTKTMKMTDDVKDNAADFSLNDNDADARCLWHGVKGEEGGVGQGGDGAGGRVGAQPCGRADVLKMERVRCEIRKLGSEILTATGGQEPNTCHHN